MMEKILNRNDLVEIIAKRVDRLYDGGYTPNEIAAFVMGAEFALRKTGAIDKRDYDFHLDVNLRVAYGEEA